ncbi:MAG: glycosyltransferase family 4 protein [Nanoarchaeota archaeon]|nr:glycosyltransferase family 4 protein [Nanoarchaeota archaeon]
MKKLLAIPNDPLKSYFRSPKEDFLGEFNPLFYGERFFDEVQFLNWRDEQNEEYFGIKSNSVLKYKSAAEQLYAKLKNFEILFDSSKASFKDIFMQDSESIKKVVENFNPNLIRAFNTHFAVDMGIIARDFSSSPLMVSAHDPTRLSHSLKEVDALVCESYELQALAKEKFGVDPKKISVIHNGIDRDFFKPQSEEEISKYLPKEFLGVKYKIFSSSRLVRGKNIETLLKAIDTVREDLPGLVHLHVGSEDAQSVKAKEIKALQKNLNLEGVSYFLGSKNKNELPSYYSWADVFVLPTLWEGLSRVMRESLACGTPVIATNYGSSTEIVQDEYNGISVDPSSVSEIGNALLRFFHEKGLKEELSQNARPSSEKYSLKRSMKMYSNLYKKILEGKQ